MSLKTSLTLLVAAASIFAVSTASYARSPHGARFHIDDANTGEVLADDGKLDGKACVVGTRAEFDRETQTFKTKPAVKCNF